MVGHARSGPECEHKNCVEFVTYTIWSPCAKGSSFHAVAYRAEALDPCTSPEANIPGRPDRVVHSNV